MYFNLDEKTIIIVLSYKIHIIISREDFGPKR